MPVDVQLLFGDTLDQMATIPSSSVDLIFCDLPYAVTACRWDRLIPFEPLWAAYRRLLKPRGVIVLTACQPFSTDLINSNRKWFRYEIVWDKVATTGFLGANRRPLRQHEMLLIFSPVGHTTYNPQFGEGKPYRTTRKARTFETLGPKKATDHEQVTVNTGRRHPTSIWRIPAPRLAREPALHPTQKPQALADRVILTFSNPGDLVLDNTMGSGTAGVSCVLLGRRFCGIERDPEHYPTAERRIHAAQAAIAGPNHAPSPIDAHALT